MRKNVLTVLLCLSTLLALNIPGNAQSRVIHYWHFNSFTAANIDTLASTGCTYPVTTPNRIAPLHADFSIIDTSKAKLWYAKLPGVTNAWPQLATYGVCFTYMDYNTSGTTVGAQFGTVAGNYLRPRNPSDSMELLLYIPTTNYQDITVSFAAENSSTTSGPRYMLYDYSLDSGLTWVKTGLSKLKDSAWSSAFNLNTISFTDPAASNNPKLVFRIRDSINTTGSSGNIRYDNFSVLGDTLLPSGTLVHFWDFNSFTGAYGYAEPTTTFPYTNPDYTIHPSANAYVHMGLLPGGVLDATNPTYLDEGASATTDYDTVNQNWTSISALGVVAGGTYLRPRNPLDSAYLYFYIPTVNYKNIVLTYASESSSYTSGDSIQLFNYSVDSGVTWRLSGISEAYDSASLVFRKIQVAFTDPAANNCATLFFRIHSMGRNTGTSGNNRYDNISLQGDSIEQALPTITTTPAAYGPFCNTASSPLSVAFTTTGTITGQYSVQLSNSVGVFPANTTSNLIGSGTTSPISAVIPAGTAAGTVYRVRVVNSYPIVYGSDNGSNITLNGVAAPISGPSTVCAAGGIDTLVESGGGTWSTSNAHATIGTSSGIVTGVTAGVDTIIYTVGAGCTSSTPITVNPLPAIIGGAPNACVGVAATLTDGTTPGTWSSSNTAVATIGSSSGTITPLAVGSSVITYTLATGCYITQPVTVNPLPSAITGAANVCVGLTITLADAGGGSWSSSNTAQATVGSTGIVTGAGAGTPTITYTLPTGCIATIPVTVNPVPAPITGGPTGCVGSTTTLGDVTAFGAWTSSTPSVATIGSSTGIATGTGPGTATIFYTLSTGCQTTKSLTINAASAAITGTFVICAGGTTTLGNTSPGGTWSSSDVAVATVGSSSGTVAGIVASTPTITYTLPTGCIATKTITINPLPAPIAGLFSLYCLPSSTTLTDATSGGVWSSGTPGVATIGSGSGLVTGVTTGTTTIAYTLPTGCNVTSIETVFPTPAAITGNPNACAGATTSYTDITAFGAWSSSNTSVATIGSGTGIATGITTGVDTILYTVATGCVISKSITVNPVPAAISGVFNVCAGGSTTALSDLTPSGNWSSSIPALANVNAVSGIVTGVAAGNPTITYTLPTGCFSTTPLTVNTAPSIISGSSTVCTSVTTTLTDITPAGVWSSSNANALIGSTNGVVTGVTTGNDTLVYTLTDGCFVTKLMTINQTPAAITGTEFVCAGLTTTLSDITGGGTWTSSVPALASVGSTGTVTGVAAGNPVISYTSSNGCYSTASFTVNPLPAPVGGVTSVYCIGSTAMLNDFITGGSWSSSNPSVATIDGTGLVTGVAAGSATITYTLPTGCITTYVENITSTPAPITGDTTTCISTNTTLSDVTAFGAWSSSSPGVATIGSGTGVVTGITSGTAIITYELSPSCLITQNVTVNPEPSAISGTTNVCIGSTTALSDAGGGSWSSSIPALAAVGAGTGIVSGIVAGTVAISYTLPTGCVTSTSLTVNPLPVILGANTICLGLPSPLTGNIPGGSWSSSNPAVGTIDPSSGAVSGITLGTTTITYTLPTGCIATYAVTVNPPPAAITGTTHVCEGLTTTLSGIGGGGWYSSTPSVATVGFGTGIVSGVSYGTAVITYSLGTSCISIATVTVDSLPSGITGTTVVCQGGTTTLNDVTGTGSWTSSNPAQATIGSSSGLVTGVAAGSPMITYMVISTGCIITTPLTVNPIAAVTGTDSLCTGLTIALGDALTGGTWSSSSAGVAAIGSASGIVSGISAGSAVITYTLPTSCISTITITVHATPAPVAGNDNVCIGSANTFTDDTTGGTWSSSDPFVATIGPSTGIVTGSTLGTSVIFYTMPNGCASATLVTVDPLPVAITGATNVCIGLTATLVDSTAGGSWSSGSTALATIVAGTGIATGVAAGAAVITYTLPTGCTATTSFTVKPLPSVHTITGGGSYCSGSGGLHIGLNTSDSGISYHLYIGSSTTGSLVAGTGSPLDFGLQTVAGVYTVVATNTSTTCTDNMSGSETITIIALPDAYDVTGGGAYCSGGSGVAIGLNNSDIGIHYQLMTGSTAVGSPLTGIGSALDYGLFTTAGTYTVIATDPITTCTRNMNDSAVVVVSSLVTPTVTISISPTGVLNVGDYDTLTAHVSGGSGMISYQWVNNNTYIAAATTATYISNGFYDLDSITVLVSDSTVCGNTITPEHVVLRIHDVSVQPVNFVGSSLVLVPNPNNGIFTIKGSLGTSENEMVALEITDMLGQVVYKQNAQAVNGELNEQILLNNSLANGMYLLNVRSGTENKVFHFVMEK